MSEELEPKDDDGCCGNSCDATFSYVPADPAPEPDPEPAPEPEFDATPRQMEMIDAVLSLKDGETYVVKLLGDENPDDFIKLFEENDLPTPIAFGSKFKTYLKWEK